MTIQAASTTRSLLPIYTGKKTQFIFWDAIQLSNTIREYSNLEHKEHLGAGRTFTVDLYRELESPEENPTFVAVKTAKLSEDSYTSGGPGVDCNQPFSLFPFLGLAVLGLPTSVSSSALALYRKHSTNLL